MTIDNKQRDEWITEQYRQEKVKPSGMAGNWSWRLKKEREYKALQENQSENHDSNIAR